jgi:hypothetical protein
LDAARRLREIALAAEDIVDAVIPAATMVAAVTPLRAGMPPKSKAFSTWSDRGRGSRRRGLLRAEREQMPRSSLVESEQRPGGGPGSECAAHAMRARDVAAKHRIERVVHARGDVVAENDSPDEPLPARVRTFGHCERRRYDRAAGWLRDGAWESSVSSACASMPLARAAWTGQDSNRVPTTDACRAPRALRHSRWPIAPEQLGSRYHGGHGVEDVLARLLHHGRRKRSGERIGHVRC